MGVHGEPKEYRLPVNINKSLKVWGMPPMYLVVAILLAVVVGIFNMYLSAVGLVVLYFYSSKFRKESKRGNPDVLTDMSMKQSARAYMHLEDRSNILKQINNGKGSK